MDPTSILQELTDSSDLSKLREYKFYTEQRLGKVNRQLKSSLTTQLNTFHQVRSVVSSTKRTLVNVRQETSNLAQYTKSTNVFSSKKGEEGRKEEEEEEEERVIDGLDELRKIRNYRLNLRNVVKQLNLFSTFPKIVELLEKGLETCAHGSRQVRDERSLDLFGIFRQWLQLKLWKDEILAKLMEGSGSSQASGMMPMSTSRKGTMERLNAKRSSVMEKKTQEVLLRHFQPVEQLCMKFLSIACPD